MTANRKLGTRIALAAVVGAAAGALSAVSHLPTAAGVAVIAILVGAGVAQRACSATPKAK